mmetsp:Transcript_90/g.188  ORF Transcript_90/g.188 Transcript_90/m.188 type:complete len:396 (-) Transcript_90:111-1298(-)|eukprot:CAMPEP_0114515800 /NCGR_PEP_ID=MMETSP0109-20121206/16959_1 /TAXON_ID=29199 /ORGANISM="Chlorarachnion reptans, Strain CCCM449" /LENGTH=395 /DNA_ID=CAMNT_0001696089 /DNA_START=213 /DNA_END=1400 /DNA_ORIENTATION=+
MEGERVVSWNILAPELSDPKTFPENTAEECLGEKRLPLILKQLEEDLKSLSVVCLQEVSVTWVGELHSFFAKHDYHYIHTLYGGKFSGYMGVGIAFPRQKYELLACEISRIADTKPWPRAPRPSSYEELKSYISGYVRNMFDPAIIVGQKLGLIRRKRKRHNGSEPLNMQVTNTASKRWNQSIMIRLCRRDDKAVRLCVATYHMPCTVQLKPVMTLHMGLLLQKVQRFAGQEPLVIAGDFNCLPGSAPYQLATSGKVQEGHAEACPDLPHGDSWRPDRSVVPMGSAYADHEGKEPPMTNKAVRQIWSRDEFSGTIDYLFYSPGSLEVTDTLTLPSKELVDDFKSTVKSFPTRNIPSDHVKIAATFKVAKKSAPVVEGKLTSNAAGSSPIAKKQKR